MSNALSSIVGPTINKIVGPIHTDILAKDGTWKAGDWFAQPAGIQTLTVAGHTDIFPSWYTKAQAETKSQISFDKVSKKKATTCTPEAAKINISVSQTQDPVTKKASFIAPDGYDASADDDTHKCDDVKPFADISTTPSGEGKYQITANVTQGTHSLQTVKISVDGAVVSEQNASASGAYSATASLTPGSHTVTVDIVDSALYSGTSRSK